MEILSSQNLEEVVSVLHVLNCISGGCLSSFGSLFYHLHTDPDPSLQLDLWFLSLILILQMLLPLESPLSIVNEDEFPYQKKLVLTTGPHIWISLPSSSLSQHELCPFPGAEETGSLGLSVTPTLLTSCLSLSQGHWLRNNTPLILGSDQEIQTSLTKLVPK